MKRTLSLLLVLALSLGLSLALFPIHARADGDRYLEINEENFPDANFRSSLLQLCSQYIIYDEVPYITAENLAAMDSLTVIANDLGNEIVSMQGIEHFYALKHLWILGGKYTSLNLSHNTALEGVDCSGALIASLNISGCSALKSLDCSNNQLQSLDISHNPALERLNCLGNKLTSLSTNNNPALAELDCSYNQIKTLDISHSTALTCLRCNNNQLSSLNVSENTQLTELSCGYNNLSSLNLSHNIHLQHLVCDNNRLPYIDLSHNSALESAYSYYQTISNQTLTYTDNAYVFELNHMVPNPNQMSIMCYPEPEYDPSEGALVFPEFLEGFTYFYPTGWEDYLVVVNVSFKHYDPVITLQPEDATVAAGDTAYFSVKGKYVFQGYQWQYQKPGESNWNDVANNGTDPTYTLTTAARHNGYKYRCKVSNSNGTVTSSVATLTVGEKPTITTQPKSVTVNEGAKATFKVVATGADSYKWQYQKSGSSTWTDVSNNGTSATYTLTTAARHNGYKYRCKVSNSVGSVTSSVVTLTVSDKPVITTQPASVSVDEGKTATFKVAATGATGYKWQYQKPGETAWRDVANNGTSATYTLTTAARHNGYKYRCKVTNSAGSVTSSVATLTVK